MVAICSLLAAADVAASGLGQLQSLSTAIQSNLDQLLSSRDISALSTAEEVLSRCDQEVASQGEGRMTLPHVADG